MFSPRFGVLRIVLGIGDICCLENCIGNWRYLLYWELYWKLEIFVVLRIVLRIGDVGACAEMRLWKFMRDLLDNPQYNPEYIRWESKSEGIFRIVSGRSKAIADLWGKIKNNPTMTFDKLGRSLRFVLCTVLKYLWEVLVAGTYYRIHWLIGCTRRGAIYIWI